jgi:RNA polymerase sigma-70 factor (ECF subfamily)
VRGLPQFSGGERDFNAWTFTIAHRRLVDQRRRDARYRALLGSLQRSEYLNSLDCETEVLAANGTEAALALIARLPHDQAEVVLLRVIGGLDTDEVAAVVGKKPGAVRVLQHRALKTLATELVDQDRSRVTQ